MRCVRAGAALLWLGVALLAAGCHGVFVRPRFSGPARTIEQAGLRIHTDVSQAAAAELVAAARAMLAELDATLAPAEAEGSAGCAAGPAALRAPAPPEAPRLLIVFRDRRDFKRYLGAHLFANEQAIGFYCELGGECALAWGDPPSPEDIRVLRHELAHQHFSRRLAARLPGWLEEGLAERLALGPLPGGPLAAAPRERAAEEAGGWRAYLRQRLAADAVSAALAVHAGRVGWPGREHAAPDDVPPPVWGEDEGGYVLHVLFVRFLEAWGEGLEGALGQLLRQAARGERPRLDLSTRFRTLGDLEHAFAEFVLHQGLRVLLEDAESTDPLVRAVALEALAGAPLPAGTQQGGRPARARPSLAAPAAARRGTSGCGSWPVGSRAGGCAPRLAGVPGRC
ncbi:MAG: hypothetical protein KatS3mg102_2780 [Planctomycetota bacterium]|nr:MAG: hypothetical protein KatS3mg102_2780 [Planctomycetota bacterium]